MNDSLKAEGLNVKTIFVQIKSNIQYTEISPSGAICHSLSICLYIISSTSKNTNLPRVHFLDFYVYKKS